MANSQAADCWEDGGEDWKPKTTEEQERGGACPPVILALGRQRQWDLELEANLG